MEKGEKIFLVGFIISAILTYLFMSATIGGALGRGVVGAIWIWLLFYVLPNKLKKRMIKHKVK